SEFHHWSFEKFYRIVEGLRLDVLWQRQSHRPAQRRIGERKHRSWESGQQLRGMYDPIEVTRNRSETIVGGNRAVSGRFHLLKDRIRVSGDKDVTRKEEDREPIDVRQGCGS